jgi:hypothetical protein
LAAVSLERSPFEFRAGIHVQQVLKDNFARFCD